MVNSRGLDTMTIVYVLSAILLLAGAGSALGQPRVTVEPAEPQVYDAVTLSVQHNGTLEELTGPPPASRNLRPVSGIQRQSSFSTTTGRSETLTWQYEAMEPGPFTIGPVELRVDGRRATIPQSTGTIRPLQVEGSRLPPEVQNIAGNPNPPASGDRALARYLLGRAFVVVDVPEELVVGWPFKASTYIFVSTTITGAEERSFAPSNASGQQFVTIPELSTPHRNISHQLVQFGNETYRRYHVHSTTLVPTRAGRTEVQSGELRTDFLTTVGRSMSRMLTSIMFETSRKEVVVRPLPQPLEGYHLRVVGNHSIATSVDRDQLNEGELVTLTIRVSGNGYLEMASLENMPEIDGLFFVREEIASRINMTHRGEYAADKTFRRTYQASRGGTIVIPPIAMANYNPRTDEQEMRRSEEIRLTVTEATGTTRVLGEAPSQRPARADAREIGSGGILHIDTRPLNLKTIGSGSAASVFVQPWYWIMHGAVLMGVLLAVSVIAVRRFAAGNPEAIQATTRKGRVVNALRKAERAQGEESPDAFYSALLAAIMCQVGRSLLREPGGLTVEDAIEGLRQLDAPETVLADLEQILERCQSVRYMPSSTSATRDQDLQRARSIVRELERIRR